MNRLPLIGTCLLVGAAVGVWAAGHALQGEGPAAPAIPKELVSYRDVVKKVLPAVVSIESKTTNRRRAEPEGDPLGFGSGFFVDSKGVVLTNYHVVEGADEVEIRLTDGRKFTSKDVKGDSKTDLAIVRIDSKDPLPFLEMGDSDQMEIGDRVLAVGAPFGLAGSVTHGIVSAKGRSLKVAMYEDYLQTDAPINPGNSGGPLVNLEGQVIGINSAIKSSTRGWQGVGLAVASNLARNVKDQLLKDGVVRRGYLGVGIRDIEDAAVAAKLGLKDTHGVLVTRVFDGGPGAKGGLKDGDVIVGVGGKAIKDSKDLQIAVAGLPLGKEAKVDVVRDGKPETLQVVIEEQPKEFGRATPAPTPRDGIALANVGLEVIDLTAEWAERLGYKETGRGALVARVERDGPAFNAGLRAGMLITRVEKQAVKNAAELKAALTPEGLAKGVLLRVETAQGSSNFMLLKTE